jgi:hypothetical protein
MSTQGSSRKKSPQPRKTAAQVLTILSTVLLPGCIAKNPAQWAYAPDQETAIKTAIADCEGYTSAMMFRAAEFGGAIVPLVALARGPAAFNQCMAAKGYRGQP